MSDSHRPESYSVKFPRRPRPPRAAAVIEDVRDAVARHVLRDAVAAYERALESQAEAREAFGDDEACDYMTDVVDARVRDAERTLVRAVLSLAPGNEGPSPGRALEDRLHPSRGVLLGGRYYLAVPDATEAEDLEPGRESTGRRDRPVMTLAVVDRIAVEELGDAAIVGLDED